MGNWAPGTSRTQRFFRGDGRKAIDAHFTLGRNSNVVSTEIDLIIYKSQWFMVCIKQNILMLYSSPEGCLGNELQWEFLGAHFLS